jgi:uncharacterized protein YdhG (YjbR/CyaY superfamily)
MAESKKRTTKAESSVAFSDEERAAMKERAREVKATRSKGKGKDEDGEADLLDKLAALPEADRRLGERIHAIVKASAPGLTSRTWYGQPAYAKDGKVLCFFQPASKFKTRYGTLGFNDVASLDDGTMWPTAFALTAELTKADEERIAELVKRAAG